MICWVSSSQPLLKTLGIEVETFFGLATIPSEMEVEAQFLEKENGIVAGIALAEMVFYEVDPTLKVEWSQKDGDSVHKGLEFGKVYGRAHSIVVAKRVVLNFTQRMSGVTTLTKVLATVCEEL